VLALAGCSGGGGGGGGGGGSADGRSYEEVKQTYVEQASAVCERADTEFAALPAATTPQEVGPYVERSVGIAEQAQRDLEALTPPERDRAELESKVLDPFATLVEEGRAFSERVSEAGTDQTRLLELLAERPTSADVDLEHLRAYGLDVCADAIAKAG